MSDLFFIIFKNRVCKRTTTILLWGGFRILIGQSSWRHSENSLLYDTRIKPPPIPSASDIVVLTIISVLLSRRVVSKDLFCYCCYPLYCGLHHCSTEAVSSFKDKGRVRTSFRRYGFRYVSVPDSCVRPKVACRCHDNYAFLLLCLCGCFYLSSCWGNLYLKDNPQSERTKPTRKAPVCRASNCQSLFCGSRASFSPTQRWMGMTSPTTWYPRTLNGINPTTLLLYPAGGRGLTDPIRPLDYIPPDFTLSSCRRTLNKTTCSYSGHIDSGGVYPRPECLVPPFNLWDVGRRRTPHPPCLLRRLLSHPCPSLFIIRVKIRGKW